jgi:hypothetical protein
MQPSLEKGQLDGWAMLTMYNPSGVFIALEELGYLLMSLAFVCLAAVYVQPSRLERMWVSTKGAERSPRRVQRRSRGQPSIAPPSFPDGMWARIR